MPQSYRLWGSLLVCAVMTTGQPSGVRPAASAARRPLSELEKAAAEFQTLSDSLGLRPGSAASQRANAQVARPKIAWHGRVFENFRNDFLDAVPHEVVQRGGERNILRRNQFGFNAGGPVYIPKLYEGSRRTFVNVSYEGVRERVGRSFLRTVAIGPERTGDFSQTVDSSGNPLPVFDPASTALNPNYNPALPVSAANLEYTRQPFAGNRIPLSRLDPVALRAVSLYPTPNASAGPFFRNNYFVFSPETNKADGMILKVDHAVSDRHRVTGTLSFTNGLALASRFFDTVADSGANDRQFNARRLLADWTFTKGAGTVNQLTMDVQTDRSVNARPGQENAVAESGLQGPLRDGFPVYNFGDYLGMGRATPNAVRTHQYMMLTNGLSVPYGRHRLRFVVHARKNMVNAYQPAYPAGAFTFGPSLTSLPGIVNTGHSFASFLLGLSEAGSATVVENPSYWRNNFYQFTVRDAYEYSKGLNLTGSFTLEASTPRTEKYDRYSTVDLTSSDLIFAGRNGQGRAFQPMIVRPQTSLGLAWNPGGETRHVVRASYSLTFGEIPMYTTQWSTQGFMATPQFISSNVQLQPALVLRNGVPALDHPLPDLRPNAADFTNAHLVDRTGTVPMYQSAGLSFERQLPGQSLVSLSLGHARGQHLFVSNSAASPNAIPLSNLQFRDELNQEAFRRTLRPYSRYQPFDVYSSWPAGNYKRHAMVLHFEKRSSSGLTVNSSFEWSKQLDDYSGPYGVQDYYNKKNEWSLTSSNNPRRLSLSIAYDLPIGQRKALFSYDDWRRYLADGWSVSSISSVLSGEPLALYPQFNNTGGLINSLRVDIVPGVDPMPAQQSPDQWFNPAAFAQPADFTPGNGPRTHPRLLTPGNQMHDLSVTKRVALSAERALELNATGFNFINRGNWADPDKMIGPASAPNVNAGRIISSIGGRVVQLGLRFSF
ncbi:hypothetical protein F183_A49190 [Bryobacterales bacterium F-183]|nr:hypothetical protein F183_A49190 [Bryobacterales bacterium F-183]